MNITKILQTHNFDNDIINVMQTMPTTYKNFTDFCIQLMKLITANHTVFDCYKIILLSFNHYNTFNRVFDELNKFYPLSVPNNISVINYLLHKYNTCKMCGKITEREFCNHSCATKYFKLHNKVPLEKQLEINKKISIANKFKTNAEKSKILEKRKLSIDKLDKKEIVLKQKKTKLERYGSENYNNPDKQKQTRYKKYGKSYFSENGIASINKHRISKEQNFNAWYHRIYTLKNKNYSITMNQYEEIMKNFNKEYCIQNFVNNNLFDLHKFKNYFCCSYSHAFKLKKELGIDIPNKVLFDGTSKTETELFNWVPSINKVHNDRNVIYPYEIDILIPNARLGIEYDGSYWHSKYDKNYHLNKTLKCLEHNIQLFHIFDFDNLDIWKSMISNKLKLNKKIYARKCVIKELKYNEVKDFLDENHLQGSCVSNINICLFYNNILIEVMTFSKPRFNKEYDYELIRLCTLKYHYVIGGASKLFKYFKLKYNPSSIISYANRRFSNGSIYNLLRFKLKGTTNPNYYYIKGNEVLSRYKCQKHKLKDLLENYNDTLSEYQNMINNDYVRIYDCGNLVFEYKKAP